MLNSIYEWNAVIEEHKDEAGHESFKISNQAFYTSKERIPFLTLCYIVISYEWRLTQYFKLN